jgi:hypothetical protein
MSNWEMWKFGFLFFAGAYAAFLCVACGLIIGILVGRGL